MSGNIKPSTASMPLLEVIQDEVVSDEKQSFSDGNINDGKQLLSTKLSACEEYESEKFHMSDGDLDGIVEITPILVRPLACNEDDGDPMEAEFIETNMKAITPDESNTLPSLQKETNGKNDANDEGEDRVKIMTVTVPLITNHGKIENSGDGSFVETNATVLNVISSKDEINGPFYALRKGKSTRNCIYLHYSHILEQLEEFPDAQHAIFDNWKDAVAFILTETEHLSTNPPLLEAAGFSMSSLPQTEARKFASDDITDDEARERLKQDVTIVNARTVPLQNHPIAIPSSSEWPSEVYVSVYNTDSWDLMYQSLKDFHAEAGDTDVPAGSRLGVWVARQRKEYQSYIAGKKSKLTEDKVEKLQAVNFLFTSVKKALQFEQRVDEFVKFKKDNGDVDPPSTSLLYKWIYSMRKKYRDMKEDRPVSGLDQLKIQKLDEIEFSWTGTKEIRKQQKQSEVQSQETMPKAKKPPARISKKELRWDELFDQLKAYKKVHGNFTVTRHGSTLGRWVSAQRLAYRKLKNGEMYSPIFNEEKIQKLVEIGFDFECKRGRKSGVEDASVWDEFYEEMKKFKEEHGHCIPPTQPSTPLRRWMEKQRSEYKKIRAGEDSYLTLLRIQRLNDIGFSFEAKCKPKTWEERYEELVEFKANFGHCKVPRLYNGLGKWVADQRQKYSKLLQDKKTNMTPEKAQKLTDLGMIWVVFKLPPKEERAERKPWAERFQELLAFQNEHGHTVVPQHFPVLGHWVHTQRVHYKLMKQGRKSLMTPEQAFQLADIGFTFEVMPRKKSTVRQSLGNPYPHLPLIASAGDTLEVTEVAESVSRQQQPKVENVKQMNDVSTPYQNTDETILYHDKDGTTADQSHNDGTQYHRKDDGTQYHRKDDGTQYHRKDDGTQYHRKDDGTQYHRKDDGTVYGMGNAFEEYGI